MDLSKEEKKAKQQAYRQAQKRSYQLSLAEAEALFAYLDEQLEEEDCDHTLRYTQQWLQQQAHPQMAAVIAELQEMGGYCDCEVLANCYEDYDLA